MSPKYCSWLLFLVVGGRAVQLQVLQGDKLMRLGQRQHLKEWIVLPKRGALFDRAGEPLALSMESQSVYARPHRIQDADQVEPKIGADSQPARRRREAKDCQPKNPLSGSSGRCRPRRRKKFKHSTSTASACFTSPIVIIRRASWPAR